MRRHYLKQHGERTGNSRICVDPVKGIYFLCSAKRTGTAFPVHVQKRTVGKSINILCEVEGCMSVAQALSYSGQPGYECEHLQNVNIADLFTDELPLSENKLEEMKGLSWISERRKTNARTSEKKLQKAQQASSIVCQQEYAVPADIFTFQFLVTKLNIGAVWEELELPATRLTGHGTCVQKILCA